MDAETTTAFILFFIISMGLISNIPIELIESGYTGKDYSWIPEEFEGWILLTTGNSSEQQLIHSPNGNPVYYDFTSYLGTEELYELNFFNGIFGKIISIKQRRHSQFGEYWEVFGTGIIKSNLVSSWDDSRNASYIDRKSISRILSLQFEDYNTSRNNIGSAWDDGKLNCTLSIPINNEERDKMTARDIAIALLTYRLPSIFNDINPFLSFVITTMIYVPIAFIFFGIITAILHGES